MRLSINKNISLIARMVLLSIILCLLFATNNSSGDHTRYYNWYQATGNMGLTNRFEYGYSLCMLIGNKIGLDFSQFLFLFAAIGLFLMGKSFYDYCEYPFLALCLYVIYPFFIDAEQFRNFMAEAIVFYAIRYLIDNNKKNIIKYCLLVIIAASFHITALICLFYLIVYIKDYKKIMTISIVSSVLFLILLRVLPANIINYAMRIGDASYIGLGENNAKFLGYLLIAVFINVTGYWGYRTTRVLSSNYQKESFEENKYDFLITFLPLLIFMASTVYLASQNYRFIRNMMPIIYVVLINKGIKMKGTIIKLNLLRFIVSVSAVIVCVYFFDHHLGYGTSGYEHILIPILNDFRNAFWGR